MDKLTIKQERFCLEYAKSGNATEAYKLAGYKTRSDKIAGVNAVRLLGNARVQNRLQEISAQIKTSKIMDIEEMQQRLTTIARAEITEEFITLTGERMEKRVSAKDSIKAIELLGKMQGAFVSRQEIELSGALPVVLHDDLPECD